MTEYIAFKIHVSAEQASRLASGQSVRLKPAQLTGGEVQVALTKTQVKRIEKALKAGKGILLTLSEAQMQATMKTGGGIWSTITGAAPAAAGLAASLLDRYGDQGSQYAADAASNALGSVIPDAAKKLTDLGLKMGTDYATHQLQAFLQGLSKSKNGKGLFLPGSGGH